jgi:hypothetical protein
MRDRLAVRANFVIGSIDVELVGTETGAFVPTELGHGGSVDAWKRLFGWVNLWGFDPQDDVWRSKGKKVTDGIGMDVVFNLIVKSSRHNVTTRGRAEMRRNFVMESGGHCFLQRAAFVIGARTRRKQNNTVGRICRAQAVGKKLGAEQGQALGHRHHLALSLQMRDFGWPETASS